jgi:hypothetical protein
MIPDNLCAKYADTKGMKKVTVQVHHENEADMVLIEGEAEALEFIGKLIITQAKCKKDCSFFIGPDTAGKIFFTKNSTHGFYIHRLPCLEAPGLKLAEPLKRKKANPTKSM